MCIHLIHVCMHIILMEHYKQNHKIPFKGSDLMKKNIIERPQNKFPFRQVFVYVAVFRGNLRPED